MKRALLAIASAFVLAAPAAQAADMPLKAPPAPAPIVSWTACYIGGNVGGGWSHQSQNRVDIIGPTVAPVVAGPAAAPYGSETDSAIIGGAQVGCDYQFAPGWVIGLQGQFDWGNLKGSHALTAFPTFTMNDHAYNFDTATARLGYAFQPNLLGYVKGGGAWARNNDILLTPLGGLSEAATWTASGWTIGGGLEYRIAPAWSAFVEYDYLGFGTKTVAFIAPPGLTSSGEHIAIGQNVQEVLFGVNYRFSGLFK